MWPIGFLGRYESSTDCRRRATSIPASTPPTDRCSEARLSAVGAMPAASIWSEKSLSSERSLRSRARAAATSRLTKAMSAAVELSSAEISGGTDGVDDDGAAASAFPASMTTEVWSLPEYFGARGVWK